NLPTTNSPATSRWWLQLKFSRRREKWNSLGCRLKSARRENWNASRHGGPNLKLPDVGHFRTLTLQDENISSDLSRSNGCTRPKVPCRSILRPHQCPACRPCRRRPQLDLATPAARYERTRANRHPSISHRSWSCPAG